MDIENEIVMCDGGNCLLRYHCHRFTKRNFIKEDLYFIKPPHEANLTNCEHLWNDNAEWLFQEVNRVSGLTN